MFGRNPRQLFEKFTHKSSPEQDSAVKEKDHFEIPKEYDEAYAPLVELMRSSSAVKDFVYKAVYPSNTGKDTTHLTRSVDPCEAFVILVRSNFVNFHDVIKFGRRTRVKLVDSAEEALEVIKEIDQSTPKDYYEELSAFIDHCPSVIHFRQNALKLIQGISGLDEDSEQKREGYRRAAKNLEAIIYGPAQCEQTDELLDALAIAKRSSIPQNKNDIESYLKSRGNNGGADNEDKDSKIPEYYATVDGKTEHVDHFIDDFDANLRLREDVRGKKLGWWEF